MSGLRESFLTRVVRGEADAERLDDEIEAWHKSPEKTYESLAQWLGLTEEEYAEFVKDEKSFFKLARERRKTNDYRRRTVFDTPINPDMGEGRYQDTLRRGRALIAEGLELDLDDCNITGMKSTEASWGLCSDSREMYPAVNDHTFPEDAAENGRRGARSPPGEAMCPFDRGRFKPDKLNPGHHGCFYRCMLFRPAKGQLPPGEREPRPPTAKEALRLYDDLIAEREAKFGRKTTEDDGEAKWEPSGPLRAKRGAERETTTRRR